MPFIAFSSWSVASHGGNHATHPYIFVPRVSTVSNGYRKAPWPKPQYKGRGEVVHVAIVMYHAAKNGNQITAFGFLMEVT